MLLTIARAWLAFLALFELPLIHGYLLHAYKPSGFFRKVQNGDAERRLVSFVLALLIVSRAIGCFAPTPASLAHVSAVHIMEMVYFGLEKYRYGGGGDSVIFGVIVFNAAFFTFVAISTNG